MTSTRFPPPQLAVVRLAAVGMHNAEIADALGVEPQTVSTRMYRAGLHAGVGGRHGLVAQACWWGQLRDVPQQSEADPWVLLPDLDLLGCWAAGLTYGQAGRRLHLSRSSIEKRSRQLRSAAGARDRAHVVLIAWQLQVLPEGAGRDGAAAGAVSAPGRPGAPSRPRAASTPPTASYGPSEAAGAVRL